MNPRAAGAEAKRLDQVVAVLRGVGRVERLVAQEPAFVPPGRVRAGDSVVVVGGDGSLHHAVNWLADRLEDVTFALVPLGTGNDLARSLGLPLEPVEATRALEGAKVRRIDIGIAKAAAGARLFVNGCLGGFPVAVDEAIDESLKRSFGSFAFLLGGVRALRELEWARVTAGERTVDDCVAFGIGNGRTAGGGVRVWPGADLGDGLLDVCVLGGARNLAARLGAAVREGRHGELDGVVTLRAREIDVESDPPMAFNLDGEMAGFSTPATFAIAGQIRMLAP